MQRLAAFAGELGSDIPFFLAAPQQRGALAVCRGRGERITEVPQAASLHVVVVRPPQGLATADVYRRCRPSPRPVAVGPLLDAIRLGRMSHVGRLLFNRLEESAAELSAHIPRLRLRFERMGLWGCAMSGSGSSVFGICRHRRHARQVAESLRAAGAGYVFPAVTSPWRCRLGLGRT
jgi:4-diphosphocytidyl-2-C-methyl-D-erythritol kinase